MGKILFFVLFLSSFYLSAQTEQISDSLNSIVSSVQQTELKAIHEENKAVLPIVFIILSILTGALTRLLFKNFKFPYTVILLVIGICMGALARTEIMQGLWFLKTDILFNSVRWASDIDPHVLLFVFLPILIFEGAFAMDLHTFKKTAVNASILAIPGIVIALFVTAGLLMLLRALGYGLDAWTWPLALTFGALISATDPVAVVAILKNLGTSKRLTTLIEGESILNDGTALVLFLLFLSQVTGTSSDQNLVFEFVRVSVGGVATGALVGIIFMRWIKKIFNDPMAEISIVIAAAYLTFYLAEYLFHVSGVLALCALGLSVGGFGRALISPGVQHFMKEFWELAGFVANTMIFLIVGMVISMKVDITAQHIFLLLMLYVIIHISRFLMIAILFPIIRKIGYGLSMKEGVVLLYGGGLRGALALSMALIILKTDNQLISETVKGEFFFMVAGIVLMTLLVNATTSELLIQKLGLTKVSAAKKWISYKANHYLENKLDHYLHHLKTEHRYVKETKWDEIEYPKTDLEMKEPNIVNKLSEIRIRMLEKEKSSYWHQFKEGLLGAGALETLMDTVNEIIDHEGNVPLSNRKDFDISWKPSRFITPIAGFPFLKSYVSTRIFKRMFDGYDGGVSFVIAQEECMELLKEMKKNYAINQDDFSVIESEIYQNIMEANTFLRNMKHDFSHEYERISTIQAQILMHNRERDIIIEMEQKGIVDEEEAQKLFARLEIRIKKLLL